jgi:hypothetical protein
MDKGAKRHIVLDESCLSIVPRLSVRYRARARSPSQPEIVLLPALDFEKIFENVFAFGVVVKTVFLLFALLLC